MYSILVDNKTEIINGVFAELTLGKLSIELMLLENVKNNAKMLYMFLLILAVDENVIQENHNKLTQVILEEVVHATLECSWSISKTKWHYLPFIMAILSAKSSARDVVRMNFDLVVSTHKIYFRIVIDSGTC